MRVLFSTSEAFPLIKTGGLADVSGSLPLALQKLGVDIRLLMPGYPAVLNQLSNLKVIAKLDKLPMIMHADLMMGELPGSKLKVMVIKAANLYEREGGPYADANGLEWLDNALRFGILSKVGAILSSSESPIADWQPDIVHCNDWQTGLTPAYMKLLEHSPAKSLISLHNMAFQGCFAPAWLTTLALPPSHFAIDGFEYHGQLSFLKAGIFYADGVTTVSPSYAKEIQTAEFGFGLEGLLSLRGSEIKGILNGIETEQWNPKTDPHLIKNYSAKALAGKKQVKLALQKKLGLQIDASAPLLGVVSRLTHQKGLDLLLPICQQLIDDGCQLVVLGSGEPSLEKAFSHLAQNNQQQVSVTISYDEALSHQIMAGCDLFIMPSRFEPCGLNQMYGLAYGTPPVVNATGGLADTVVDTNLISFKNKTANGFVMSEASSTSLLNAIKQALNVYKNDATAWKQIQINGMNLDLTWDKSALAYLAAYQALLMHSA